LIFFDRTYDRVEPKGPGPEDTLTHVGIALRSDLWIGAEDKIVGMYTFRPDLPQDKLHGYASVFSDSCAP